MASSRWNASVRDDPPPLNPYTPPVAGDATVPASGARLWMVNGDHLLVRDGALLPPVPLTGSDGDEVTSSHQIFAVANGRSILLSLIPMAVAVTVGVIYFRQTDEITYLEPVLAYFITSRLLGRFIYGARTYANIQCHLSVPALKSRARRDRLRMWLNLGATMVFVLIFVFLDKLENVLSNAEFALEDLPVHINSLNVLFAVGSFAALLFFASAFVGIMERGVKCVRQVDGWFYLSGVPAASLAKLAAMEVSSPPVRPREVYSLYQYNLPMAILAGPRRNPWLLLMLAILKAKRSPTLVRKLFASKEARKGVAPGARLAEQVAELRGYPDLASWLNQGCHRIDSPQGEFCLHVVLLASPDRQHFCYVKQVRFSKSRIFLEIHETEFRTWSTDGRCFVTTTHARMPVMPDYVDNQQVKSDPAGLWERHRQRCAGITPLTVENDEALGELMKKLAADEAALLEAAGIQSPVEVVELPGAWEEIGGEAQSGNPFARLAR